MKRLACLALLLFTPSLNADDWPQWLGPKRDSVWREKGIVDKFPEAGLPVVWRAKVSDGFSGPAVANGLLYVTDYVLKSGKASSNPGARSQLDGKERIFCLRADNGKEVWSKEYECTYRVSYSKGPRATPTVDGDRVYILGAMGHLWCLNAKSGKVIWSKLLTKDYKAPVPIWGFCAHPLVEGNQLICLVGGAGSIAVSFDKRTGKELWRSLSAAGGAGYCPPTMIHAGGRRQLVIWHPESVNGLNPQTGKVYWTVPLKPDYTMSVTAPRQFGDYLYVSGHVRVGALLKLNSDVPGATVAWRGTPNKGVYCCNSTPLIDKGIIYGVCATQGQLRAVELKTGKRLWQTFKPTTGRRVGHGTAYIVRLRDTDRYFMFNERGDLILARFSPKRYEEISRMHVLDPTSPAGRKVCWSHPAFANRCVFIRNDKQIVCLSLAKK